MERDLHIKIFTVGGTIDKEYFDAKSKYEVGPPKISIVLGELNLGFDYTVQRLLQKDSLDISDTCRGVIYKAIIECEEKRILITHGTDTMVDTAKRLSDIEGKTIVLTGSLTPALFRSSDAVFNIGCAIAAVQLLDPGVYIVMNGCIFPHDGVIKNVEKGKFERVMRIV